MTYWSLSICRWLNDATHMSAESALNDGCADLAQSARISSHLDLHN